MRTRFITFALVSLCLIFLLSSCGDDADSISYTVNIRVINMTENQLESVAIGISDSSQEHGPLQKDSASTYIEYTVNDNSNVIVSIFEGQERFDMSKENIFSQEYSFYSVIINSYDSMSNFECTIITD